MVLLSESHNWCINYRPQTVSRKSCDHSHDATNQLHLPRIIPIVNSNSRYQDNEKMGKIYFY